MTRSSINEIFDSTSFLHGSNTAYIEEMFIRFQSNPESVPNDWKDFFLGISQAVQNQNSLKASWSKEEEIKLRDDRCRRSRT